MAVLIFAESSEGKFKKAVFEAVVYGRKVADMLGTKAVAVCAAALLLNDEQLAELSKYGANEVVALTLTDAQPIAVAEGVAAVANEINAKVIVISNNYTGKAITPFIAIKLKASVASGVVSLPDTSNGFIVKRGVYSGKAFALVNLTGAVKVVSITPNSFAISEFEGTANITNKSLELTPHQVKVIGQDKVQGKVPLTEAELVVSAGRGMKGPENWHLVEELANQLGAATACSKPVSDMHWRPHEEHVGQTGITIKPNLYIAIGISGAIQHLAGVSSSKVIVAINKDPEAPFFKVADYGIVGDAFEVLPQLIEASKSFKSSH